MNLRSLLRVVFALGVAILIGGISFGFANSWGGSGGLNALWAAALICFASSALAIVFVGILQEAGKRPSYAPPALHWAIGVGLLFTACAATLTFVLKPVPTTQLAVWLGIHCVAQVIVQFVLFRATAA
jgi:hypothetical protein